MRAAKDDHTAVNGEGDGETMVGGGGKRSKTKGEGNEAVGLFFLD